MGDLELMQLEVSGPEDWDTATVTNLSDNCNRTSYLEQDDVRASYWWVGHNPGESYTDNNLLVTVPAWPWNWMHGDGIYGSHTDMAGIFVVWDGRQPDHARHDSKMFPAGLPTVKVIPDKLETLIRLDHPADQHGTGCHYAGTLHGGAFFYHPLSNRTYSANFEGLMAKEHIIYATTDAPHDPTDPNDDIVLALNNISGRAIGPSTADSQNRLNDNHLASGGDFNLIWQRGGTTVLLLQEWHIITFGWKFLNPDHAIQKKKGPGWHANVITYIRIRDSFVRCIKDGVTCLCQDPQPY